MVPQAAAAHLYICPTLFLSAASSMDKTLEASDGKWVSCNVEQRHIVHAPRAICVLLNTAIQAAVTLVLFYIRKPCDTEAVLPD